MDLATKTQTPRRSLVFISGLVALVVAVPAALAVTGGLKASQPTAARSMELVVNGDFEDGVTGWKTNHRPRQQLAAARPAANGKASAALTTSEAGTVMLNDVKPTVNSTSAGRSYSVTAYVRSSGPDLSGRLRIREVSSGTVVASRGVAFRATDSAWSRVELAYTTASDGGALDLNVLAVKVPTAGGLLVDDVSMVAMEPSSSPTSSPTKPPTSSPTTRPSSSPTSSPTKPPTSSPTTSSSSSPTTSSSSSPTSSPTSTPTTQPGCVSDPMGIPTNGTYLGAAVGGTSNIVTREQQLGRKLALHRTFYSSTQIDRAVRTAKEDLAAGRLPWISFKEPLSWSQMAAGDGSAWVTQLADALKTVPGPVWLAVHHEPEGDGDMAVWTKMQQQIAPIIHARTDNVAYSVIYSGWNTFGNGTTNTLATKWPGDANIDITAVDAYNSYGADRGSGVIDKVKELKAYYTPLAAWSKAHGTAWAIGETGQTAMAAAEDPNWLDRAYHDMKAAGGAGLSYFDSSANSVADWTLDDPIKRARFKALLPESPTVC